MFQIYCIRFASHLTSFSSWLWWLNATFAFHFQHFLHGTIVGTGAMFDNAIVAREQVERFNGVFLAAAESHLVTFFGIKMHKTCGYDF